jgi:hypothetical protein
MITNRITNYIFRHPLSYFPQRGAGASENSPVGYFSEQACLPRWPPCRQAPSLNQPTGLVLNARPSRWGNPEYSGGKGVKINMADP